MTALWLRKADACLWTSWQSRLPRCRQAVTTQLASSPASRALATSAASLGELLDLVSRPPEDSQGAQRPPVHVVHSMGHNPFANLAVEHRLFERAHADSRLLLLYRNAPCVVIGRNQNPWTEVNLGRLAASGVPSPSSQGQGHASTTEVVQLVRRRSGGGAVYHDAGNANWSVHVPAGGFDRDRHALMVARALQALGVATARVNERHDIVVGDGDGHGNDDTYKVSGSAYKLTSRRALHHGTCLLGADLAAVSGLLREPPAAPYMKARGVASVRSPVRNVFVAGENEDDPHHRFAAAVAAQFERMYGPATSSSVINVDALATGNGFGIDPHLAKGFAELMTADWLFGQTPQFVFSTRATADDPRARPLRPLSVPPRFELAFTARHGHLQDVAVSGLPCADAAAAVDSSDIDRSVAAALTGQVLYRISDWRAALLAASPVSLDEDKTAAIGAWLDELFGVRSYETLGRSI